MMLERITEILRNYKGDDSLQVNENSTFEELGLDSLDTVQLVMDIEEEFDITIEMDKSIKDISCLLKIIETSK